MRKLIAGVLVVALALLGGSLASAFGPLRDLYDTLFHRQTFVATGDVVLRRLQEQKELVVATGTFDVPVVVCNGTPESYDLQDDPDKDDRTPAQQLLEACDSMFDEKATVLVSSEVDATIDLGKLDVGDIVITGTQVTVTLPPVTLADPRVDAEDGVSVIAKDGSVPLVGGDLPEDYLARAAGEAKKAISKVAGSSGLPEMGRRSARELFEGLLKALGFTDAEVIIAGDRNK